MVNNPFEITIDGSTTNFTNLYGFLDVYNEDVNVKTTPGTDALNIGGFSLTDIDKDINAGETIGLSQFNAPLLTYVESAANYYHSVSGTLTVTNHDKANRTITGTMSGTLRNAFNTSQTKPFTANFNFAYPTDL